MDYFNIKCFIEKLNNKVVDNYEDWIMLGQFLYNINNNSNYLNLWIEKSKCYSDKYDNIELVCNNVWSSMIHNNNNYNYYIKLKYYFMDKTKAPIGDI